jgi:aryl-alcohol dehydrogenase-like predicted oxidoreductase
MGKLTARARVPNTNLDVSPLCLGTMTFGVPVVRF